MTTAFGLGTVLWVATQSVNIEFVDCHEPRSCQPVEQTRVAPDRQHRALFAEGVASYIEADRKLPADDRGLLDSPNPEDPVYVVTSPRVPLAQSVKMVAVSSVAAAEALAQRKGRRLAVTEFKLSEASNRTDRAPAVDVIISSGTIVPQPRTTSGRLHWRYVSQGFSAYHVYRRPDGQIVFRLQARAAD